MNDYENLVRELQGQVAGLMGRVAQLEDQRGRIFPADLSNPGSTNRAMQELFPTAGGTALANLLDGRTVSGLTDPGVFLAIPRLKSNEATLMGFTLGSNTAYVRTSDQLRYGKIVATDDCHTYANVKECTKTGTLLTDTITGILPTKGGCDTTANSFCYSVGDVITYMEEPDSPGYGIQVGAYKAIEGGHTCLDSSTNTALVPDLSSSRHYNGDFFLKVGSNCGGSFTNTLAIYWRGMMVTGGYQGHPGTSLAGAVFCGATNAASMGGVKILSFDGNTSNTASISGYTGSNLAKIQFDVTCDDTTANRPTINGVTCADYSLPKAATIKGFFPVGVTIDASDPSQITVVCNEDGTISWNGPTMRCVVPFP